MRKALLGSATLVALGIGLVGCGSSSTPSSGESSSVDVTVVDGYVKDGNVTDADGVQAAQIDGTKGLYRFSSTPTYPIKVTVGTGKLVDTNESFDINMTAYEGTVISPISTLIGNDAQIKANIQTLLGGLNDSELFVDFVEANNTAMAKLSQLAYAAIKDETLTSSLALRLGAEFNALTDDSVTALIDSVKNNLATKASTKVFLSHVNNLTGSVADYELELNASKSNVGYVYVLNDRTELNTLLHAWDGNYTADADSATTKDLEKKIICADTSNVTTMYQLISLLTNKAVFNLEISGWDTSNVSNMAEMFAGADAFNQDIGDWDTSMVLTMSRMFDGYSEFGFSIGGVFNQDIGDWDTSRVTDMSKMFRFQPSFNQDIGNWDTSKVTDMSYMFYAEPAIGIIGTFNQDIGHWNTENVWNMAYMLRGQESFNQGIGGWNTANAIEMRHMFELATSFNQSIGAWNVSKVEGMGYMFAQASSFNRSLEYWDTGKVGDMTTMSNPFQDDVEGMNGMFYGATAFNQDISGWDVHNVVDGESGNGPGHAVNFYDPSNKNPDWDVAEMPSLIMDTW